MNVKQVIVIRKDLKMRRGKEIAQGAHAACIWLIDRIIDHAFNGGTLRTENFTEAELEWMTGSYKKVTVTVNSEAELWAVYHAGQTAGLKPKMIEDLGLTEFGGKRTLTAVALGPDLEEKFAAVTGHLPLY